jgi:hypothetical protein
MLSIIAVNRRVASSNLARQRYWSNSLGQFESASLSNTLSIYRYLSPGPGTGNYTEIFIVLPQEVPRGRDVCVVFAL